MKLRANFYIFTMIMVVMLLIIFVSLRMEHIGDGVLPILFSSLILIFAGIELWREFRASRDLSKFKADKETNELKEVRENWRLGLFAGAWIVGFFLGVWLLGFIIAIPFFIVSYMKSHGMAWRTSVIYATVTLVIVVGIFELGLEIKLYRGLFYGWLNL